MSMHLQEATSNFFQSLFSAMALESEGALVCAGDFNMVMDSRLDTSSQKEKRTPLSKLINMLLKEHGLVDVWRELHPMKRDYTHYSTVHTTHSRIDYILMNSWNLHKVKDCKIGVADVP